MSPKLMRIFMCIIVFGFVFNVVLLNPSGRSVGRVTPPTPQWRFFHKLPNRFVDDYDCSKHILSITYPGPLGDFRGTADRYPEGYATCFVFSTLMVHGGTEAWMWTLYKSVFTRGPFYVWGVRCNDIWAPEVVLFFTASGVRWNPSDREFLENCDVIIQTGVPPTIGRNNFSTVPLILVIHGDPQLEFTRRYTQWANQYDAIVSVSEAAIMALPHAERQRAVVIPSGIPKCKETATMSVEQLRNTWKVPSGKKVLLLMGRISDEKRPHFFVNVVHALPEEWVGLLVGPKYWDITKEPWGHGEDPRIILAGTWHHSGDPLAVASAVLLPSRSEGGPLVMLEAWAARVPIFMLPIGLAARPPERNAVFVLPDVPANATAQFITLHLGKAAELQAKVNQAYQLYQSKYALSEVAMQWARFLMSTMQRMYKSRQWTPFPMNFVANSTVRVLGPRRRRCLSAGSDPGAYEATMSLDDQLSSESGVWIPAIAAHYSVETADSDCVGELSIRIQRHGRTERSLPDTQVVASAPLKGLSVMGRGYHVLRLPQVPFPSEHTAVALVVRLEPRAHVCFGFVGAVH